MASNAMEPRAAEQTALLRALTYHNKELARTGRDAALGQFENVVGPIRFPAENGLTTHETLKGARTTPDRLLHHAVFTAAFEADQILHESPSAMRGKMARG